MTDFDLQAARRNTPNWPPMDGDIWTDRNGRDWLTNITVLHDDRAVVGFHSGNTHSIPRYTLEMHGPLTLKFAGHERQRFDQLPADARERRAAYFASVCWFCGPEGATGDLCDDCDRDEDEPEVSEPPGPYPFDTSWVAQAAAGLDLNDGERPVRRGYGGENAWWLQ